MQYVWYGAYGSNLSNDRLMRYLAGGKVAGSVRPARGARDTSPPTQSDTMLISRQLYFGYESITWGGGGIAFLSPEPVDNKVCLLRLHRVTLEQFCDIYAQENRVGSPSPIDVERLEQAGHLDLLPGPYGRLVFVQRHPVTGEPVATFTSAKNQDPNPPSIAYLRVIARGLRETWNLDDKQIADYLGSAGTMADFNEPDWPAVLS